MSLWGNYAESASYYVIDYGRASSRSLSGGTPSGFDTTTGWVATQPYPSSTYPYIWQRSRLYNPNTGAYGAATYVCITGADGPQGDDGAGGVDITTDPTVILIRQIAKPVGNNTTDFGLPMDIGFSVREGSTAGTVTSISISQTLPPVGVAVQRKDGEISKAQITAVVPSNNTYPTKGYFYAVVNYTVNNVTKSVQVKVPVYIDLIGEIVTTIEGDVETTVAHDIGYAIDPSGREHIEVRKDRGCRQPVAVFWLHQSAGQDIVLLRRRPAVVRQWCLFSLSGVGRRHLLPQCLCIGQSQL